MNEIYDAIDREKRGGDGDGYSSPEEKNAAKSALKLSFEEKCEAEKLRIHSNDKKIEQQLKLDYSKYSFWFAVSSAIFFAFVLVWNGCSAYYMSKPPFSDTLLIALTTAVTVNLFAAFLAVTKGLFCSKKEEI